MEKEEVLKKAQAEQRDEMAVQVRDQSMRWTYLVMVLSAAVFAFLRSEQGLPMMDLCATVCFSVCAGQVYRFIKLRRRFCLILAVITLIVGIFAVIRYLGGH